jgi:UDP-glucose 4-epimerase
MTQGVLVTGADGFVGKTVCHRLLEYGLIPRAGLWNADLWPALQAATAGLSEFAVIGDIGANPDLRLALKNISAVVHLAARVHIMQDRALDPLNEFRRVNVGGVTALARAAAAQGVQRFVFVSSVKVNGETSGAKPFSEGDVPAPQDPYAVSKWEAEEALRRISAETGLEVVIIRPPLVYGPGVRANFLRLMGLVKRGIPLPFPDTKNRRSLIGVENLADCLMRCVTHPDAANHTFMVSDGEDISTRELAIKLAPLLGRSARFLPISERALRFAARLAGEQSAVDRLLGSLEIDSGKVRRTLGWVPPVALGRGLEATASWYLDSLKRPA